MAIDWFFWRHMPHVELWQAAFLACNCDPNKEDYRDIESSGIENADVKRTLLLLKANRHDRQFFTPGTLSLYDSNLNQVRLSEVAGWCLHIGIDIPEELSKLAGDQSDKKLKADCDNDNDEALAALFDPVPIEALAKMFPTDKECSIKQWKIWQDKAKTNGLIDARTDRGKFNPYKAGLWFVCKGHDGWDTGRLNRVLANNLPARSIDVRHQLTGELG